MENENLRSKVSQFLIHKTDFLKVKDKLNEDQLRVYVDKAITNLCYDNQIEIATEDRIALIRDIVAATVSLGPLRPLMEDPSISEIMVNGPKKIYIQRKGKIELTDVIFTEYKFSWGR